MSRYACVRQVDENDCGAACLATAAEHYGLATALHKLRDAAGTGREGVTLLGLNETAKRIGFETRAVEVEDRSVLERMPTPWIAHVLRKDLLHFVVVHRAGGNRVILADPADGIRKVSREEFDRMWSGYALLLAPAGPLNEEDFKRASPLRRILRFAFPFRGLFFHALLGGLILTVLALGSSFFNRFLFDEVLPSGRMGTLHLFGMAMVAVTFVTTAFGYFRSYLLTHLGQKVNLHILGLSYRRLLRLPMSYFHGRKMGDILRRLDDVGNVQQAITGTFLGLVLDVMTLVVAGAVLVLYEWRLALLVLATGPFFLLLAWAFVRPLRRRMEREAEEGARLSAQTIDNLAGIAVVKGFGAEEAVFRRLEGPLVQLVHQQRRTGLLGLLGKTLSGLVHGLATLGILWVGGAGLLEGSLTLGQIILFTSIAGYVIAPLQNLANANVAIQGALVSMDRLADILDTEEEPLADEGRTMLTGEVRVEGVRFAYGYGEEVLRGVDLSCRPGEWTAIVGESGAGKSTLFHLLQRFHDPKEGRILLDGFDLRDLSLPALRRQLCLVDQECQLFAGSILENLRLGRPEATLEEVVEACRIAGAAEFVERLPQRYHTVVGERGIGLSGGERQRLALARALVARPSILLLDEATAHLDVRLERDIVTRLRRATLGQTVLFCTHRLGLARCADRIVVFERGRIVEQGTHERLLRAGGRYAAMWARQVGSEWDPGAEDELEEIVLEPVAS